MNGEETGYVAMCHIYSNKPLKAGYWRIMFDEDYITPEKIKTLTEARKAVLKEYRIGGRKRKSKPLVTPKEADEIKTELDEGESNGDSETAN